MYDWKLGTAVKLAEENFLSSIQIGFNNSSTRPYFLQFVTCCGDTAKLVTTHTQKEKRKIRDFSSRGAVIRFLEARFPGYDELLHSEVKVAKVA
ncbi:hypothetical protein FP371_24410 [Citrobacter freundii]|uniref:hypothetical protein n=1 Tax=Gammaproteobacteria TaxID=1236 RepID=UPI0005CFA85A|nr:MULTISPECIES: hypothetical protein [Gammaproteobacteria]EEA2350429.1 hypothetical protein [Salmonella enterica subsp. enterica serovar Enteritidis]EEC4304207.1 hypothetical protein [Salmonella enterica subsp. enterica serovar Enteritidis]EEN2406631.1 hypothetical protein [Salmonella enterica subsp. enterica serovar Enteritidis]EES8921247.1 hypothetical protein [Escherichia coli]EES9862655.1 hypothetical protein [Escherichia coli]